MTVWNHFLKAKIMPSLPFSKKIDKINQRDYFKNKIFSVVKVVYLL